MELEGLNGAPEVPDATIRPVRYEDDTPLPWRSHVLVAALGPVAFLLFQVLSALPAVVEPAFATTLNPVFTRVSSHITGIVPFPILEPLVLLYLVRLGMLKTRGLVGLAKRRRSLANSIGHGLLRLGRDAGVVVFLFYAMWGFNYARSPLRDRLGWPAFQNPETAELAALATEAVAETNRTYLLIHDTTDADGPTALPDVRDLDRALEAGWRSATDRLGLDSYMGRRYGRTKGLLTTPVVSRLGISGFYFPWTTEANVLRGSPGAFLPHSMAHEKAHQRGIGPEEEANFLGYVVAALAPDPYARYSAHVFAQSQLLQVLAQVDPELARSIAAGRFPGVQRDIDDAVAYWGRRLGVASQVSQAVNHQFLRANRVHGGIASYRQSVQLIVTYMQNATDGG